MHAICSLRWIAIAIYPCIYCQAFFLKACQLQTAISGHPTLSNPGAGLSMAGTVHVLLWVPPAPPGVSFLDLSTANSHIRTPHTVQKWAF